MKISEALLLRKQLQAKIAQLEPIKLKGEAGLFETKVDRVSVNDSSGVDEVRMSVPKIELSEITKEYDKFATALRKLDAAIQEANWTYEVKFNDNP